MRTATRHKEKGADGVCIHSQWTVLNQFGNQRVVRNHIQREEEIVAPHEGGNPYGVQTAHTVDWRKEHQQRA